MKATKGQRTGRWPKSAMGIRSPPMIPVSSRTSVCGSARNDSSRPSSCMTSSVEGWIVSPRKSRRKSACFSSTTTSTPARASSRPSIIPAGPPPTTQQTVETVEPQVERGGQLDEHGAECVPEGARAAQEERERRAGLVQPLDVGEEPARLDGEDELGRDGGGPGPERGRPRQAVEGTVE